MLLRRLSNQLRHAGARHPGRLVRRAGRGIAAWGVVGLVLAACTISDVPSQSDDFTLPVLSLDELQNLLHASLHEVEGRTPPVSFAAVICGAKGYRHDGENFAACAASASRAVRERPVELESARTLAKMVDRLAAMKNHRAMRIPDAPGAPFVCYDLTQATVSTCQDI